MGFSYENCKIFRIIQYRYVFCNFSVVLYLAFFCFFTSTIQAEIEPSFTLEGGASSLGFSVAGVIKLTDKFSLTIGGNKFPSFDITKRIKARVPSDQIKLSSDINLESIFLLGNYHPFEGNFHIGAGLLYNNNLIQLIAEPNPNQTVTIQGVNIPIANIGTVTGEIKVNKINPYLGVGWGYTYGKSGIGVSFDFGLLYWGEPHVFLRGSNVTTNSVAQLIELQIEDLTNIFKKFQIWPWIGLKVYYSFD